MVSLLLLCTRVQSSVKPMCQPKLTGTPLPRLVCLEEEKKKNRVLDFSTRRCVPRAWITGKNVKHDGNPSTTFCTETHTKLKNNKKKTPWYTFYLPGWPQTLVCGLVAQGFFLVQFPWCCVFSPLSENLQAQWNWGLWIVCLWAHVCLCTAARRWTGDLSRVW